MDGSLYQIKDAGLLILKIGIGGMMVYHGLPKILGGAGMWNNLGKAINNFGITWGFTFWGFMSAFAEFFGGIALILGLYLPLFCSLLVINMIVATVMHLKKGDGLPVATHPIENGIVFLSLIFIGAGKLNIVELCKILFKK